MGPTIILYSPTNRHMRLYVKPLFFEDQKKKMVSDIGATINETLKKLSSPGITFCDHVFFNHIIHQ